MTRPQTRVMPPRDPLLAFVSLPFQQTFYPYGFPVRIKSNAQDIIEAAEESWGTVERRFEEDAIEARYLICNGPKRRSAGPVSRLQSNILSMVADEHNYACCDLAKGFGAAWLTDATISETVYLRYTFLEGLVYTMLESLHLVAVHAACVAKNGRGVLLAADSGVGKSSLAYACACRGWIYVSDDASSLIRRGTGRKVIGNPRLFRFRPAAAYLFPELERDGILGRGLKTKFRKGKPTIEVATGLLPHIQVAEEADVDHVVFLRRRVRANGSARMEPVSKSEALRRLLPNVWPPELPFQQQRAAAIERLLDAELAELSYWDFGSAIGALEELVR